MDIPETTARRIKDMITDHYALDKLSHSYDCENEIYTMIKYPCNTYPVDNLLHGTDFGYILLYCQ